MVRVNILDPRNLADQHLVAEYLEILMLVTYIREHPDVSDIPSKYCLAKGHMKFFKNKVKYLAKRHERLKKEMKRRGFKAEKSVSLTGFGSANLKDWRPSDSDKKIIRKRLIQKLRMKPKYYLYKGEHKPLKFFVDLVNS